MTQSKHIRLGHSHKLLFFLSFLYANEPSFNGEATAEAST